MTDREMLLACPFCGGEAMLDELGGPDDYFVHCVTYPCEVQQIARHTPAQAITAWNTRAEADRPIDDGLDWQPIETAPKDGTRVLLYCGDMGGFNVGFWQASEPNDGDWSNWLTHYDQEELPNPTHWMPLPVPPALAAHRGEKP